MMQKGQALIFILLGIVMIGFLGVAFYAGKITPKLPSEVVTSTPSPTSSPSPVDETANWKTYTPSQDIEIPAGYKGFTFKYPPNWEQSEGETGGLYFGLPNSECGQLTPSGTGITISGVPFEDTYSVSGFSTLVSRDQITIDGYKGIKQVYYNNYQNYAKGEVNSLVREVIIKDPKNAPYKNQFGSIATPKLLHVAQFIQTNDKLDKRCEDTFDKILTTFKFLDQNQVDISSWKIYTNTKDGYSIKYPPQVSVDKNGNFSFIIRNDNYSFGILPSTTLGTSLHELNPSTVDQVVISECPDWGNQKSCSAPKTGSIPNSVQIDLLNRHYASTNTIIKNGNVIYEIDLGINSPNTPISNEAKQIYNQMLSTFKFLK